MAYAIVPVCVCGVLTSCDTASVLWGYIWYYRDRLVLVREWPTFYDDVSLLFDLLCMFYLCHIVPMWYKYISDHKHTCVQPDEPGVVLCACLIRIDLGIIRRCIAICWVVFMWPHKKHTWTIKNTRLCRLLSHNITAHMCHLFITQLSLLMRPLTPSQTIRENLAYKRPSASHKVLTIW